MVGAMIAMPMQRVQTQTGVTCVRVSDHLLEMAHTVRVSIVASFS